jgi:hypothetical protein
MATRLRELNEEWAANVPVDGGPFDDDEEDGTELPDTAATQTPEWTLEMTSAIRCP